ncbi:unnamed protein product [Ambrosiozyma monospora]|uniref:Unnamed protein product n=1 Tax=Ambrosiozyma monospora TaxID=43982 RepID=A0A9W6SZ05_AMBMO|nr:unnamed protein product [Ambrosiozyma monospora]
MVSFTHPQLVCLFSSLVSAAVEQPESLGKREVHVVTNSDILDGSIVTGEPDSEVVEKFARILGNPGDHPDQSHLYINPQDLLSGFPISVLTSYASQAGVTQTAKIHVSEDRNRAKLAKRGISSSSSKAAFISSSKDAVGSLEAGSAVLGLAVAGCMAVLL